MENLLARKASRCSDELSRIRAVGGLSAALLAIVIIFCAGCSRLKPVDTSPLVNSGMNYGAIQELTALKVSTAEVGQIAEARQSGFSGDDCVEIVKIYRSRNQPFNAGHAVSGMMQAGMNDANVLELAKLNELGLGWGELQAMKLAGLSDAIVMEEARQRANGKSVLTGATLARLKNAGVRESTLLKLVERAVPASKGGEIVAYRRRGASEAEILRHFTGS
jgi:hypothetical protein